MAPYSMDLRTRVLRAADAGMPSKEQRLVFLITARPDATLSELREQLPTSAALSTLWRTIEWLNVTKKNRTRRRTAARRRRR